MDVSSASLVTNSGEEADDWDDSDLPSPDFPVEQFVSELEERMISGQSRFAIRQWAFTEHGVDKKTLNKFSQIVRASWAYADMGYNEAKVRRQNVRDKLEFLFKETVREKQFRTALDVVNTLAELDGLKTPDINLTQINQVVGHGPQITNRTRERVAELMETMRLRQDQRAMRVEDDQIRLMAAKSGNGNGSGPKNGNGSNGHG